MAAPSRTLRQSMAWLHTWVGLVAGWVLFFVFVTGTAGYFQLEITRWMQPERPLVTAPGETDSATLLQRAFTRLEEVAPGASYWRVTLPHEGAGRRTFADYAIRWQEMPLPGHEFGASGSERLDPATGEVLAPQARARDTAGGAGLYRMHYALHYIDYWWAYRIVGLCTMLMLLAIVSGIITHKKILRDFFTFRPGKGQRSWLDGHNAVSVMALPFFLMITYTGLVLFLFTYMPLGRDVLYGGDAQGIERYYDELFERTGHEHAALHFPEAPLRPILRQAEGTWGEGEVAYATVERHTGEAQEIILTRRPTGLDTYAAPTLRFDADTGTALGPEPRAGGAAYATQTVMFSLHEGTFASIGLRWLYFVSGLLGCAMIGSGLVLWTVKRRRHHLADGHEGEEHPGVRLVEVFNGATIAGLPLAIAAFFWANRLLPLDLAGRADWEFHALFAVWLGTLFYALARPLRRAWIELLWASCAAFALIVPLNLLTSARHLGVTVPAGDWALAGFDLTMLALAGAYAFIAVKVRKRLEGTPAHRTGERTCELKESRA